MNLATAPGLLTINSIVCCATDLTYCSAALSCVGCVTAAGVGWSRGAGGAAHQPVPVLPSVRVRIQVGLVE